MGLQHCLHKHPCIECCFVVCGRHSPHNAILMEMGLQSKGHEALNELAIDRECRDVLQGNPAA